MYEIFRLSEKTIMKSNQKIYPKQSNWHYYLFLPAAAVCFVILAIVYFGSTLSVTDWEKFGCTDL